MSSRSSAFSVLMTAFKLALRHGEVASANMTLANARARGGDNEQQILDSCCTGLPAAGVAAEFTQLGSLRYLLRLGIDVNRMLIHNGRLQSPLFTACQVGVLLSLAATAGTCAASTKKFAAWYHRNRCW